MAKPQAISAKDMLRLGKAEYGGKRFAFWMAYYQDEFLAAKAVYENPPSFDVMWRMRYPDPEKYRKEHDAIPQKEQHGTSNSYKSGPSL